MAVEGSDGRKISSEDVDNLDSSIECDKNFVTKHNPEFHQRILRAEADSSQEYALNQASAPALRITKIIGAQVQEVKSSYNMILFGAERQTPIGVNSMLMESLSKVILEAPIENEDEIMTESATPIKFIKTASESDLHRIVHLINGGTVHMTPREELGLTSTLRAIAMGEFCGAIVPAESASADVEGVNAADPEWPNPNKAVAKVGRKRGRPRTREPVIGPKRPRGRPRLAENMLRRSRELKKSFRVGPRVFKMSANIAGFNKKGNKEKGPMAAGVSSDILSMDLSKVKARMAERWRTTNEVVEEIRENLDDEQDTQREMRVHSTSGLKMTIRSVGSK